jgi:hypothetical protein
MVQKTQRLSTVAVNYSRQVKSASDFVLLVLVGHSDSQSQPHSLYSSSSHVWAYQIYKAWEESTESLNPN